MTEQVGRLAMALCSGLLVAACGGTSHSASSPKPPSQQSFAVTFKVADGSMWKARLVEASRWPAPGIPNGRIVRGSRT